MFTNTTNQYEWQDYISKLNDDVLSDSNMFSSNYISGVKIATTTQTYNMNELFGQFKLNDLFTDYKIQYIILSTTDNQQHSNIHIKQFTNQQTPDFSFMSHLFTGDNIILTTRKLNNAVHNYDNTTIIYPNMIQ